LTHNLLILIKINNMVHVNISCSYRFRCDGTLIAFYISAIMLKDETIEFLAAISPFDRLDQPTLSELVEDIAMEYYPKGVKVLTQDGPPSEYLRIIKKGAVKVFRSSSDEDEIIIDFRGEGDQFGLVSVISGDRSRANVMAVEDTICYLISKDKIVNLFQTNPEVNDHFMRSFFVNFIDKAYDMVNRGPSGMGETDRRLFTTSVGSIISRTPVVASQGVTIQRAAGLMVDSKVSSIVLLDDAGIPSGILTDRDLREKVVARGMDIEEPIKTIMSSPLLSVGSDEFCFEVLMKMVRFKIHHMLVMDKGEFKGVVTNHDFMVLQGSSPTVLVKEIEEAQDTASLADMVPRLYKTVATLLFEGAKATNIAGLITEIGEKLILKGFDLVERELGTPPVSYSVFLYGGSGRRELTLTLNIRIGIIFDDSGNLSLESTAKQYFSSMASRLNTVLGKCCPGSVDGVLQSDHTRSLAEWKNYFNSWKHELRGLPEPQFFDIRHVKGNEEPVDTLVEHLFGLTRLSEDVMDLLATATVENRPPLGFFRRFVVEKSGEHRNEFDLTLKGIRPLVDAVRVFALEKSCRETSTLKRLIYLRERFEFEYADDIGHALNYLDSLLIKHQLDQIEKGLAPDTFVNPARLSSLEKNSLKEIFKLTTVIYDIIEKSYRTERVV